MGNSISHLLGLFLFDIVLDEVGILLDLVLSDAHLEQLIQNRPPCWIGQVNSTACAALWSRWKRIPRTVDGLGNNGLGLLRLSRDGTVPVPTKKIAHAAVVFVRAPRDIDLASSDGRSKWLCLCLLAGILLPLVHLLLELPCFFLVDERQAGHALFELEGMEKGTVLVILEGVIDLLVPDDTSVGGGDVDHFEPESIPN